MKISTQIGNSHVEAMKRIVEFIDGFNLQRLLYAIDSRHFDEETIESITLDIRDQNVKLERQKKSLFAYTKNWCKVYCHPDNKLVEHSAGLIFRMRSGVSGIKRSVKKFCKPSRRRLPFGSPPPQAIDRSLISPQTAYMETLFGLEHYPPCVGELFAEMVKFYTTMYECLQEAERSLDEEKATRGDWRMCLELLREACAKSRQHQVIFVEMMDANPALKATILQTKTMNPNDDNPVLKEFIETGAAEDARGRFASRHFHNCTLKDVDKITLYRDVTECEGDSDLFVCMTLFNCEAQKARKINLAIRRFDSILPDRCKRGKVPALHLYVFMRWCSDGIGYETFLNYFFRRYKEAGGLMEPIGKSALSGAARKENTDEKFAKIKRTMLIKLDNMFPKEQAQQSA